MAEDTDLTEAPQPDTDTTCSLCYAEFLDPEDLKVHFNQVHLKECSQHCQFCTSVFPSMDLYALHLRDVHIMSFMACKYCTKVFTDFDLFRKHESKHGAPHRQILQCSQCRKRFSNLYGLQQHELINHNNDDDGIVLNECFPLLSSCLNIKAINFIISLGQNAAYVCTRCVFTSASPDEYISHLQKTNCISVVCNNCCNTYKDKKGLIRHLQNHKECYNFINKNDLTKLCVKCENSIVLYDYNDHIKKCKPMKCTLCNIILNSMEDLTYHQTTVHPMAITMTRCKFCHQDFVGNVALQKHIARKHKDIHSYKYMCVYCDMMYFNHPQRLFCHFFSKHTELQPYSCKICNLIFRVRKRFTIHIKMEHKSIGFVEFDERYHVFFTDKKSENPFLPKSLFGDQQEEKEGIDDAEVKKDDLLTVQTDIQTDVPTEVPTDAQTDVEETKQLVVERKPPKIRFKEQKKSKEVKTFTIKSEVMSEGNFTECETREKSKAKQKKKRKNEKNDDSDSDDEPLIKIKRNSEVKRSGTKWNMKKRNVKSGIKKPFTCNVCKKYCYTYQNYNHHMSFHYKNEIKKCIKCSKQFSSKEDLNKHIAAKHSTSKLTETLRGLLERRKMYKNGEAPDIPSSEKFRRTIKKVKSGPTVTAAKLTEITDKLSVKNFLETFTPEEREESIKKEKHLEIQSSVTVKTLYHTTKRPPLIKMMKFIPKPSPMTVKLAMPVRFKPVNTEKPKLRVKLVQNVYVDDDVVDFEHEIDNYDYKEEIQSKNEIVPEVAQEVMLETQEQQPQQDNKHAMPHKIILPKLPKNCTNNDIKIAHLLPVAPFYKIVKMTDVLENKSQENNQGTEKIEEDVKLPGGTKLVNVNPLAHLIGNTPVEKIVGLGTRNYKPKTENFEKAVAKALLKLESSTGYRKKKPSNKKKKAEEQEVIESSVEVEQ